MAYDASVKYKVLQVIVNGGRSKVTVVMEMLEKNIKPRFQSNVFKINLPPPSKQIPGFPLLQLKVSDSNHTSQKYLRSRLNYFLITWSTQFVLSRDDGVLYLAKNVDSIENSSLFVGICDSFNPISVAEIQITYDEFVCGVFERSFVDVNMARDISNATVFFLGSLSQFETLQPMKDMFSIVEVSPEKSANKLVLNPKTAEISLKSHLDIGLTIALIRSHGCEPTYTLLSISANSVDRSDNLIQIIFDEYFVSLAENQPIGSYVTTIHSFVSQSTSISHPIFSYHLNDIDEASKLFQIDESSGEITTTHSLNNVGSELFFEVIIDALPNRKYFLQSATTSVRVKIDPEPKQPFFPKLGFHFEVNFENNRNDVIGTVTSTDEFGRLITGVVYYLKERNDYFLLNRSTGDVKLIKFHEEKKKSQRSKLFSNFHDRTLLFQAMNSSDVSVYSSIHLETMNKTTGENDATIPRQRFSRDMTDFNFSDESTVVMMVVARSGFKIQKEAETTVSVKFNKTCWFNCSLENKLSNVDSLSGTQFILLIVFLSTGTVLCVVFVGLLIWCLISRRRNKSKSQQKSSSIAIEHKRDITFHDQSYTFDLMAAGSNISSRQLTVRNNLPSRTRSESSGRGSALGRETDEEIRMINDPSGRLSSTCSSSETRHKYLTEIHPDSGILDEDMEEEERLQKKHSLSQNKADYSSWSVVKNGLISKTAKSVQMKKKHFNSSMKLSLGKHENLVATHEINTSPAPIKISEMNHIPVMDVSSRFTDSLSDQVHKQIKVINKPDCRSLIRDKMLTESNGCLSERNPNYESLSSVFDDISQLKHDNSGSIKLLSPKRVFTKIVPQVRRPQNFYDVISAKIVPPPIITDVPPPSVPLATHPALMRTKDTSPKIAPSTEGLIKRSSHWSSPARRPIFHHIRKTPRHHRTTAPSDISIYGSKETISANDDLKRRLKTPRNASNFVPCEQRSMPMTSCFNSSSLCHPFANQTHASTPFPMTANRESPSGFSLEESDRPALNTAFATPYSEFGI